MLLLSTLFVVAQAAGNFTIDDTAAPEVHCIPRRMQGGGCNLYGCWAETGGGCNLYGCWAEAGGGCNLHGCWAGRPRSPRVCLPTERLEAYLGYDPYAPGGCNRHGCWSGGGGCNLYGCWQAGGGCNLYGCWHAAAGSCNVHGCSDHGVCNVYGCPPRRGTRQR